MEVRKEILCSDDKSQKYPILYDCAFALIMHPVTYVRILIQVGHEPLPAKPITSIFGKEVYRLPNLFQYAAYIKKVDGWTGLYRGLGPHLIQNLLSSYTRRSLGIHFAEKCCKIDRKDLRLLKEIYKETILVFGSSFLSYPFHVISIRMMVQFIGRETLYNTLFSSIKEIYSEEGIVGFFSGFIPYLISKLSALWFSKLFCYILVNIVYTEDITEHAKTISFTERISKYFSVNIVYRFDLVSNIMAVNNTKLAASSPPVMPLYSSWKDCYKELGKKGLQSRGLNLFRRNSVTV